MGTRRTSLPEDDDDTIELELTAEEMAGLSQAARNALPPLRRRRWRLWPMAVFAAVTGLAAVFAWRPAPPHRVTQRTAPAPESDIEPKRVGNGPVAAAMAAPVAANPLPAAAAPAALPAASGRPVRVRNPFDGKEIFEFPAGTPRAEARRKVTQLLLERAIGRGSPEQEGSRSGSPRGGEN